MIAGCDICQEVCPWTRRAPVNLHPEFGPEPRRLRPRLEDIERLDEEGFAAWRRGSALNRISYAQFRRNLQVARENLSKRRD
jgi:epoxyqueuosine reductase